MNSTTDRDPLDLVAEEFAERCRRGEMPSVTDFVGRYPALAEDLRDLLPAVAQMELLKRHRHSSTPPATAHVSDCPAKLGDYRIIRELGRGGMGIVYEAIQESLGRRVALKMLPLPGRNDAVRRERFLREAQVAAKLHHTNIVPVFGVGEENGIPYFVMQFIPGCGLNDAIASWKELDSGIRHESPAIVRPNQWRRIAEIGVAAANALAYAHGQGVLHRDVKPGNLLLDHHGTVWIADFGLAKLLDHHTLTATGDLLGTIPYMAPEALRGEGDHRADVYGLGMTLYELVTGTMPFNQSNPAVLIREIGEKDPPTPRTINPRVPRDLETIVLKAIAREPNRRYANAAEMAADLDAFLNDQPIRARRSSTIQRSWLWAKRNPFLAMLSTITAGAVMFAAVVGWMSYSRTSAALASERKLLKDAEEANKKLLDNLNLSLAAFEAVFEAANPTEPFGFGPPRPDGEGPKFPRPGVPEGEFPRNPMRPEGDRGNRPEGDRNRPMPPGTGGGRQLAVDPIKMLEAVLDFYEKFAEQNANNPKLQTESETNYKLRLSAAKAYRKVGQVNAFLMRTDPNTSAQPLLKAIGILNELLRAHPDAPDVRREYVLAVASLELMKDHRIATGERLELIRRAAPWLEPGPGVNRWTIEQLARMAQTDGDRELADAIRARAPEFRQPDFRPGGERPNGRPGEPGPRRQ
jgi:eukaryotic-like serine/threonine-protein kinase